MVKEKPNSIRIYDSEGYRRRAACICVKNDLEDEVSQQMAVWVSLLKFTWSIFYIFFIYIFVRFDFFVAIIKQKISHSLKESFFVLRLLGSSGHVQSKAR